jgi:hypothetical protein
MNNPPIDWNQNSPQIIICKHCKTNTWSIESAKGMHSAWFGMKMHPYLSPSNPFFQLLLINSGVAVTTGIRLNATIGIPLHHQEGRNAVYPDIYREIKRRVLFLEYALDEIEATLAGTQARNGAETARVRRDALVCHFDRIRAMYLGLPSEIKL